MPACATRYAGSPPISALRKRTEPALGLSAPAIRLKVVLLPEPFGPIRPRISPSATSKETFLTARKPSKLLVSPSTSSTYLRGKSVPFRERQHRVGGLHGLRPGDACPPVDVLHDDDERALVLAGHRITRRQELDAVALHRPADRDIDLERRLAQRLRVDATVFLDRHRQHLVEQ